MSLLSRFSTKHTKQDQLELRKPVAHASGTRRTAGSHSEMCDGSRRSSVGSKEVVRGPLLTGHSWNFVITCGGEVRLECWDEHQQVKSQSIREERGSSAAKDDDCLEGRRRRFRKRLWLLRLERKGWCVDDEWSGCGCDWTGDGLLRSTGLTGLAGCNTSGAAKGGCTVYLVAADGQTGHRTAHCPSSSVSHLLGAPGWHLVRAASLRGPSSNHKPAQAGKPARLPASPCPL